MYKKLLTIFFSVSCYCFTSDSFCSSEPFKRAHIGAYIINSKTGEEILKKNEDRFFIPASLQKIALSAVASYILGDNYQFKTHLLYQGEIKDHELFGNLYIQGGGDPSFSQENLAEWKKLLERGGIYSVRGKVYLDVSAFETAAASPYWEYEDLGNYFGAGSSALTIDQNMYKITLSPGEKVGESAKIIKIDPEIPGLSYKSEVLTGPAGSGDQMYVFGSEYNSLHYFRGTIPMDIPTIVVKAAMPDPAKYVAHLSQNLFQPMSGVEIISTKQTLPLLTSFQTHYSPPLKDLLRQMNANSINLYAEHILKVLGGGQADLGAHLIEKTLADWNIPSHVKDGSGLARRNCQTPKGFVTLLERIKRDPLQQSVYCSIAENQSERLIKKFPILEKARLKTKTGSMAQAHNLAGYFTLPSGEEFIFAFFCNHYLGTRYEVMNTYYSYLAKLIENLINKKEE